MELFFWFFWLFSLPGDEQFILNDPPKTKLSKFGGFCNFARKSFGSSFEHLFKVCLVSLLWSRWCIWSVTSFLHVLNIHCHNTSYHSCSFFFLVSDYDCVLFMASRHGYVDFLLPSMSYVGYDYTAASSIRLCLRIIKWRVYNNGSLLNWIIPFVLLVFLIILDIFSPQNSLQCN